MTLEPDEQEHEAKSHDATDSAAPDDDAIRALVTRLARPHRSGGRVIERATLMAEGHDFRAVIAWIEAHGGQAEAALPPRMQRGLHSARPAADTAGDAQPLRFILPPSALG